jgi:hypothetical protein
MAIWVIKDGQREGPYEEQDVRELIYEGTYSDSDAAIRDGQFDWSTLGQVLGRQPASSEPPPSEASPPALNEPAPPLPIEAPETAQEPEPPPLPAAPPEIPPAPPLPAPVVVVDFQMPFGSMVLFMVKWVIASIPALLILFAIAATFWGIFISIVALLLRH